MIDIDKMADQCVQKAPPLLKAYYNKDEVRVLIRNTYLMAAQELIPIFEEIIKNINANQNNNPK